MAVFLEKNPYVKTDWVDHIVDPTVSEDDPNHVIQEGTRFTASRANNIEEGIYNAFGYLTIFSGDIARMQAELEMVGRAPINNGSFLDVLDGSTPRNLTPQNEKAVAQAPLAIGATSIQLDANPFAVGTVVTVYDDVNAENVKVTANNGASVTVTALTKTYKKGANLARTNAVIVGEELTFGTWGTFTVTATEVV